MSDTSGKTTEQIIADGLEARNLVRMMYIIIMSLPGGSHLLLRHLDGEELPSWVTERPRRVRTSGSDK